MNTVVKFVSTTGDDLFWFLKKVAVAWDVISLYEAYQSLF
jgi:hypothetical protein